MTEHLPFPSRTSPRAAFLVSCLSLVVTGMGCWLPGVDGEPTVSKGRYYTLSSEIPATIEPFFPDVIVVATQTNIQVSRLVVTQTPIATYVVTEDTWDVVVEQGDTLYSISDRECGDARGYAWLEFLNGKQGKVLEIGETIRVSCEGVPSD